MWNNTIWLIQNAIALNKYFYNPNDFSTRNNHIPILLPGESSWTEEPGRL